MIPCHVIAGSLGVGKTTTIIASLKSLDEHSRTAVIVNDFGQAGLDAEAFRDASGELKVKNIPGGCLCCSSMLDIREALATVLKQPGLNRIIIEPSGLAIMPDLVPYLKRLCEEFDLELRPLIALLNPRFTKEVHYKRLPFFSTLVDHADILVANRGDQCSKVEVEHFLDWTSRLKPSKLKVYATSFGQLPREVFEIRLPGKEQDQKFHLPHSHNEHSGGFVDATLSPVSEEKFRDCIRNWIKTGVDGVDCIRFKALLPTDMGWRLFEIAEGTDYVREMAVTDAAKIDWISSGVIPESVVREALSACKA